MSVISPPVLSTVVNRLRWPEPVFYNHCVDLLTMPKSNRRRASFFLQCDVLVYFMPCLLPVIISQQANALILRSYIDGGQMNCLWIWSSLDHVVDTCSTIKFVGSLQLFLHLATYEMWCWSGGRGILTELPLCYSIVYQCNGAQWYEQFLQTGWMD